MSVTFLLISLQYLTCCCELTANNATTAVAEKLSQIIADEFPAQTDVEFDIYQFNVARSNVVALDRSPPDVRPPACRRLTYDNDAFSDVSVIIPFFDESWSMLLRTLHGVLDRTPDHLLHEIIIIDDFSSQPYLKAPLDHYAAVLSHKIHILRNVRREGLIRARLAGARAAQGGVLVFLDAHVEVNHGWLPPLLELIRRNQSRVVVPRIDSIDPHTIEYEVWDRAAVGSLTWAADYIWKLARRTSTDETQPTATATTIGCALAVDRQFFFELGAFDDGMLIWGGENLELSVRAWTCAGGVHVAPCSRVAHLFRRMLPYRVPTDSAGYSLKLHNYRRLVDVWFDDYRKYYYATERRQLQSHGSVAIPTVSVDQLTSMDARRHLRRKLSCRSFRWYLENVATDLVVPELNSDYFGQLQNANGRICACSSLGDVDDTLSLIECGWRDRSQTFALLRDGTLVANQNRKCLTATVDGYVVLRACSPSSRSQTWTYELVSNDGAMADSVVDSLQAVDARTPMGKLWTIIDVNETVCLTQVTWNDDRQILGLLPCRAGNDFTKLFQYWLFTYSLDWNNNNI